MRAARLRMKALGREEGDPAMALDVPALNAFYASAQGAVVARLLRQRLTALWPESGKGLSILGLGFAAPYLRLWREEAARCIHAVPAEFGTVRWPGFGANLTCAVEGEALPFPDLSFDRILIVHGLETAGNARRLLREVWRVLRDDGRLLVIAANRVGLWAHVETTPFGQGEPYSPGQIERLLRQSLFRVERRESALYLPPFDVRPLLRLAPLFEAGGRRFLPRFAGVALAEAVKDVYAGVTVRPAARRKLVLADARLGRLAALSPPPPAAEPEGAGRAAQSTPDFSPARRRTV